MASKKRVSVAGIARSAQTSERQLLREIEKRKKAADSFQNFAAQLGVGTGNQSDGSTYGFNPITRIRTLLEWIHRGSWVGGVAVDLVADDMTRAEADFGSIMDPSDVEALQAANVELGIWDMTSDHIKWGRLYGGSLLVPLIDGQDPSKPLRKDVPIGRGQFRGLCVLDRWMVEPSLNDLVTEYGPNLGNPKYYDVRADAPGLRGARIHYTRAWRMEGIRLPYWQRIMENMWGISVIERLYDRLIAFDSATQGAAQLVFKSYLRTYQMENLREVVTAGGDAFKGLMKTIDLTRQMQSIEGMSVIDKNDDIKYDVHSAFSGLSDALMQFGQQIAGALQIPLVRLFGMSPTGFNSTGESDLQTYYEGIKNQQMRWLRRPLDAVFRMVAQSEGIELPDNFTWKFNHLHQLTEKEKSEIAQSVATSVNIPFEAGMLSAAGALKELRQSADVTGIFSNITDEDINKADQDPPEPSMGEENKIDKNAPQEQAKGSPDKSQPMAKDRVSMMYVHDMPLVIETAKGEKRWASGPKMPAHYGYIRQTSSGEGPTEQMDAFVGPDVTSPHAFIVNQKKQDGTFDEHKVMLGYGSMDEALWDYMHSYDLDHMKNFDGCCQVTIPYLKDWLKNGDVTQPFTKATAMRRKA